FLAGTAIIVGVLLSLPATRATTMLQLRRGTPLKFLLRDKSVEQVLREHPNDPGLDLAAVGRDAPLAKYEGLFQRFPDDATISTLACSAATKEIAYLKDNSSPTDPFRGCRPERASRTSLQTVHRAIALARHGVRVEPDNAFTECLLADFLIAKGDDTSAL